MSTTAHELDAALDSLDISLSQAYGQSLLAMETLAQASRLIGIPDLGMQPLMVIQDDLQARMGALASLREAVLEAESAEDYRIIEIKALSLQHSGSVPLEFRQVTLQ